MIERLFKLSENNTSVRAEVGMVRACGRPDVFQLCPYLAVPCPRVVQPGSFHAAKEHDLVARCVKGHGALLTALIRRCQPELFRLLPAPVPARGKAPEQLSPIHVEKSEAVLQARSRDKEPHIPTPGRLHTVECCGVRQWPAA